MEKSDIDKIALVGECKFKNEKIDKGVYETLLRRSGVIAGKYHVKKLLFFSLSGYTEWSRELKFAKQDTVGRLRYCKTPDR